MKKNPSNDLEKYGLKGKVLSVKEVKYHATTKNGQVIKGERAITGYHDEMDTEMFFSSSGMLIKYRQYYFEGKEQLRSEENYQYDSKARMISSESNYSGISTGKSYYTYTDSNHREEIISYENETASPSFRSLIQYDSLQRMISNKHYTGEDKLTYEKNYKYDSIGRKMEAFTLVPDKPVFGYKFSYDVTKSVRTILHYKDIDNDPVSTSFEYYDKEGDLISDSTFNRDSSYSISEYEYDNNGNRTKSEIYWNGILKYENIYKYIYDSHGNWIRMTVFDRQKAVYVNDRSIHYLH